MGVIDAMASIVTGTMQMDPDWGETRAGLRRRRIVITRLEALEADPPDYGGGIPDIAAITAVVAVDDLRLSFKDVPWRPPIPRLQALRDALSVRPAFAATAPTL